MKKIFALITVSVLAAAVILCGCSKNTEKEDDDSWKNQGYDLSLPELNKDG